MYWKLFHQEISILSYGSPWADSLPPNSKDTWQVFGLGIDPWLTPSNTPRIHLLEPASSQITLP
jgi:hypothetical protein